MIELGPRTWRGRMDGWSALVVFPCLEQGGISDGWFWEIGLPISLNIENTIHIRSIDCRPPLGSFTCCDKPESRQPAECPGYSVCVPQFDLGGDDLTTVMARRKRTNALIGCHHNIYYGILIK